MPPWDAGLVHAQVGALAGYFERLLELGRFQALLPPALARREVAAGLDLARFEGLYRAATVLEPSPALRIRLAALL